MAIWSNRSPVSEYSGLFCHGGGCRPARRRPLLFSGPAALILVQCLSGPDLLSLPHLSPTGVGSASEIRKEAAILVGNDRVLTLEGTEGIRQEIPLFTSIIQDPGATIRSANSKAPPPSFWLGRFRPLFVRELVLNSGKRRLISLRNGGLLYSDNGNPFQRVRELPRRFVPEDYGGPVLYRDVEDLWQNPLRPQELLAVVKHQILRSDDGGGSFFPMGNSGIRSNYTAIAARTDRRGRIREIFLGTSVNGIHRIFLSRGKIRRRAHRAESRGLSHQFHDEKTRMYEEVSGLVFDSPRNLLLATTRLDGALYVASPGNRRAKIHWRRFRLPVEAREEQIQALAFNSSPGRILISTNRGLFVTFLPRQFDGLQGGEKSAVRETRKSTGSVSPEGDRLEGSFLPWSTLAGGLKSDDSFFGLFIAAKGKAGVHFNRESVREKQIIRGLYISPTSARRRHRKIMELIDNYAFNAAVIDVKDDIGRLIYGSELPEARAMNNHRERAPIRKLITKLKKKKIYLIARQVVFKDARMFQYKNSRFAGRDRFTGKPWIGNELERWVDPYSVEVQNYNIRVAREVLRLGFDEIQFDYIRFPSDGPVHKCRWTHKKGNSYRSEALEAFLRKARITLQSPLSVDIYGYNGMYRVSGLVGQDLIDFGDYVDVISPMHYSSHYGPKYLDSIPRKDRAFTLLKMGSARPLAMGHGRFAIRPWLQSFRLLTARWGWGSEYMASQIRGTLQGGGSGFLWWGPIDQFTLPGRVQKKIFSSTVEGRSER